MLGRGKVVQEVMGESLPLSLGLGLSLALGVSVGAFSLERDTKRALADARLY